MDFEKLLKAVGDPAELDKMALIEHYNQYLDRVMKLTAIAANMEKVYPGEGKAFMDKQQTIITRLTDELDKAIKDYQDKHGEI